MRAGPLPVAPDVDLNAIAGKYAFTGGEIKSVAMRLIRGFAVRLSGDTASPAIRMASITEACEEEIRTRVAIREGNVKIGFGA